MPGQEKSCVYLVIAPSQVKTCSLSTHAPLPLVFVGYLSGSDVLIYLSDDMFTLCVYLSIKMHPYVTLSPALML